DWLRALANNQRMASRTFGVELGALGAGSAADLVVLDYTAPTPVTGENFAEQFVFGLSSVSVESVMAAGRFAIRNKQFTFDERELYSKARKVAVKLWERIRKM